MIPTFFTTLALGTITALVPSIMALSTWVAGSQIIQGNTFYDTTNNASPLVSVGISQVLGYTTSGLNFITNGYQTGSVIKAGGTTVAQRFPVACTATGGLWKYPTCITASPYTSTGVLTGMSMECGGTAVAITMSGAFVKSRTAISGTTTIPNFGTRKIVGSGSFSVASGANLPILWNPVDLLKIATVTSIPPTTNFNCTMFVQSYDKFGS